MIIKFSKKELAAVLENEQDSLVALVRRKLLADCPAVFQSFAVQVGLEKDSAVLIEIVVNNVVRSILRSLFPVRNGTFCVLVPEFTEVSR